jgi:endoglucanase
MQVLAVSKAIGVALLCACACSEWEDTSTSQRGASDTAGAAGDASVGPPSMAGGDCQLPSRAAPKLARGLHVVGRELQDENGRVIQLHGVNRSGSEYACIADNGFFDGPTDDASIRALLSWNVNAVRIPLNESCWLAINGASPRFSGPRYQAAIQDYVARLEQNGLVPILELHRAAPGSLPANKLFPMPNAEHTPTFWREVATTFLDDSAVVFEPYNEPFPDRNRDSEEAWACWRDGCLSPETFWGDTLAFPEYEAVGMQELVSAIRDVGAKQLILLGGVQYSNSLSGFLAHTPEDPLGNLAAAWHIYNFNACASASCWNGDPSAVLSQLPIVATEIGQDDCQGNMVTSLMDWLDAHDASYLAWWWNVSSGDCKPAGSANHGDGPPLSLISDYLCPSPKSGFGQAIYDHYTQDAP